MPALPKGLPPGSTTEAYRRAIDPLPTSDSPAGTPTGGSYAHGSVGSSPVVTPVPSPGGGGSTPPGTPVEGPPPVATPPPPVLSATIDPQLQALSGDWREYINDLKNNTGHTMDVLATKTRDAREGGAANIRGHNIAAGRLENQGLANYEGETQRQVQGTLADVAMGREAMRGQALTGAGAAAEAPLRMALAEKGLGLDAYRAHGSMVQAANAANMANYSTAFNQMMALLDARRSSPTMTEPVDGGSYSDPYAPGSYHSGWHL